jgi:hypothetical protein
MNITKSGKNNSTLDGVTSKDIPLKKLFSQEFSFRLLFQLSPILRLFLHMMYQIVLFRNTGV